MIINLGDLSDSDNFDYCIVGAGPAGITCAISLSRSGAKVLLLEGGEFSWTRNSQDLYKGEVIGDAQYDLDASRLRYFGGTSNHWGGTCRQLDAIDFDDKVSGYETKWPISKSEIDPYLDQACKILQVAKMPSDELLPNSSIKKVLSSNSRPVVRFREQYFDLLSSSKSIYLVLDANALNLTVSKTIGSVEGIVVAHTSGLKATAKAKDYIVALGGIENSRFLLWSNNKTNNQIVRNNLTLGRYWMDHLHYTVGHGVVHKKLTVPTGFGSTKYLHWKGVRGFSLTPRRMRDLGILNARLTAGLDSSSAKNKIKFLMKVAPGIENWATCMISSLCSVDIQASWEQAPSFDNRIELSQKKDRFGVPLVNLYWNIFPIDFRTIRLSVLEFGRYLLDTDLGRIKIFEEILGTSSLPDASILAGFHHMGGTRMSSDPVKGVVDRNCRVHGQTNLYVIGSSVFSSGGHANPTLTIVQLSLRLSNYLKSVV